MNNEQKVSRRTFLDLILGGGLLIWGAAVLAPILSYVWPAQKRGPGQQAVSAGKDSEFTEWQTKMISVGSHPVIVLRTPQGYRAYSAICTHLGCVVGWDAARRQIACPCHAGVFDVNGKPVAGPPPKPLAEYGVVVVNGEVLVKSA